jgi:SAM-dependent methyltransferase
MTDTDSTADTDELDAEKQRTAVRDRYSEIAAESESCCGPPAADSSGSCCGSSAGTADPDEQAQRLGYDDEAIDTVADGANLGLGCGNPNAIASLDAGETVLDLGSGAGFDCFLAADAVGETGRVIGVDMTPEMIEKARANVDANDADNVEFRLGEIEHLPVADAAVDVIISNCVINLSPDKQQVFHEAYRVLEPGGRLAISDVVLTADSPDLAIDPESVAACVGGAAPVSALEEMLAAAGFTAISIEPVEESEEFIREWDDERDPSEFVVSARIEARKPTEV